MRSKPKVVLCIFLLAGTMFAGGKAIKKYPGVTVRTLVQGAPIHGHNGLCFGPDGNLYLASVGGNEIIKMDPNSGRFLDRIGPERGVSSPDDLTFGPDGSLYWTAIFTGDIGKLASDGAHGTVVNLGLGVNPITFSPDNRWLYVARDFFGKGLYRIDPNDGSYTVLLPDLENFNAFDFGPDGRLYGPIYGVGVIAVDVNTLVVENILDGIACSAVKFDSKGRLITNNGGEILRHDLETKEIEILANLPSGIDNLAINSDDEVYASADGVFRILPNGNFVMLSPGGMMAPNGVAVLPQPDGRESVYVTDIFSLYEFDGRTGETRSLALAGITSAGLASMIGALSTDGHNLIVSAGLSGLIQRWDPIHQQVLDTWYNPSMPQGAVMLGQDLIASELSTGRVTHLTPSGWEPIAQFAMPVGLATNGAELWAADYYLGRVFKVLPYVQPVADGLQGPTGLAYYPPDGSLLVVEANAGRLSKIDPATGDVTILAEGLQVGYSIPLAYNAVAVGSTGAIYVTGVTEGRKTDLLYRIEIHR